MTDRLQRGNYVRVRMEGDAEWIPAFVALASPSNPSSVMLMINGLVRAPGGYVGHALPLTINYESESVSGLLGGSYEIEVQE